MADDEMERVLQRWQEILAWYKALDPDVRAELEKRFAESDIDLTIARVKDGSIPDDEAERWLDAVANEFGQRKAVN